MPTYSSTISASTDDADQSAGTVDLTGTTLNVNGTGQYAGLRFTNVTIPNAATINTATLDLEFTTTTHDDPDIEIYAEDTDDAATFAASSNNISSRTPTTATTTWTATSIGTGVKTTPSIAAIIQEIINRPGWTSGNDIAIILHGLSSSSFVRLRTLNAGTGSPATLNIDYTTGGGGSAQPPRTNHQFRQRRT